MKHLHRLTIIAAIILLATHTSSGFINAVSVHSPRVIKSPTSKVTNPTPFAGITVKEFLSMTPKRYKALTGKRMSFSQKISLKLAQYKVKKLVKKNKPVNLYAFTAGIDTADINIGGLVLGLLLGPIGVLIGYLIDDRDVIKWAWIGFGVWILIGLLFLII